ncbi:RNA polymerase sigma factor [Stieleria varia]|nr:RNA polymerase sigma factor [Stieleria varia]
MSKDRALREDAWIRMTSVYGPIVHRHVRRSNISTSEIADVVQTVFFKASTSIDAYHHSRERHGSFRAWLYGITNNVILDFYRKRSKTPMAVGGTESTLIEDLSAPFEDQREQWEPDPENANSATTFAHQVIDNIKKDFSSATWQCFWRLVVQGEAATDIGTDLKLNAAAVRQAKFRVLKRLREELDGLETN